MGGHEAEDVERYVVLAAGFDDGADGEAVVEEGVEGEEASGDAAGEGEEADGDVVGHDGAGGEGLHGEDGVGPHFVMLDGVHHLGAEHGVHEGGAQHGEDHAEERGGEGEEERGGGVGEEAAEEPGVVVREEAPESERVEAATGVDEMMRPADEAVEVGFKGAGGLVRADRGEVGGGLAVEQAEVAEVGSGERLQAEGFHLLEELLQAGPVGLAEFDPAVGEHERAFGY